MAKHKGNKSRRNGRTLVCDGRYREQGDIFYWKGHRYVAIQCDYWDQQTYTGYCGYVTIAIRLNEEN